MTLVPRFLERWRHRLGWLGISLLLLPILGWVWLAAREPVLSVFSGAVPRYVISGRLFSEPFNTVHAGFVMDQPTIGKWLFWFSVMAVTSLPWVAAVGWLADRSTPAGRLSFQVGVSLLGVFLLCLLSWPLLWLIQYVWSMGFTPKRVLGLAYALAGGLLVVQSLSCAFRTTKARQTELDAAGFRRVLLDAELPGLAYALVWGELREGSEARDALSRVLFDSDAVSDPDEAPIRDLSDPAVRQGIYECAIQYPEVRAACEKLLRETGWAGRARPWWRRW